MEYDSVFDELDNWFYADNRLLIYQPKNLGRNIRSILEHISLTNHFLLILIRKGTYKTIIRAQKIGIPNLVNDYDLDWTG